MILKLSVIIRGIRKYNPFRDWQTILIQFYNGQLLKTFKTILETSKYDRTQLLFIINHKQHGLMCLVGAVTKK